MLITAVRPPGRRLRAAGRTTGYLAGTPISAGAGAHGPRDYDWARIPIRTHWRPGRGHWLLARRKISDPTKLAHNLCYGPRRSRLHHLVWIAGSRWRIEECFPQAKNEAGLDHDQVRAWRADRPRRHRPRREPEQEAGPKTADLRGLRLVCPHHPRDARPRLARHHPSRRRKRGTSTSEPDMINLTLPEIRRLLTKPVLRIIDTAEHVWAWSRWRRRRQHQARHSHYKRRGHPLT